MNRVSVVTVCYNVEDTIEETINSIIAQSSPPFEYLIVDGASTDSTLKIVESKFVEFEKKSTLVKLLSEKDIGIYDAMNKATKMIQGEWVYFLNAGDVFYDDQVLNELNASLICCNDIVYGDIVMKVGNHRFVNKSGFPTMNNPMPFSHQGVFLRSEHIRERGFDLRYKLCADYDLFNRLYQQNLNYCKVNMIIALYEADSGASSVNGLKVTIERFRSNSCFYSFYDCCRSFCIYCLKIFISCWINKSFLSKIRFLFYKHLYNTNR